MRLKELGATSVTAAVSTGEFLTVFSLLLVCHLEDSGPT